MRRLANILSISATLALLGALAAFAATAAPRDIQLPPETVKLKPSSLPGFAIAIQKCSICHSADYISYQPPGMNQSQWTAEMVKMQHIYGAPIDATEIKLLGIYLAATYGDAKSVSAADLALTAGTASAVVAAGSPTTPATAGTIDVQALLGNNACLSCHGLTEKIVGPGYHDVATKYKTDPDALSKLEASIRGGGMGKWGPIPMPPFAGLSEPQLKALAEFVMQQ